MKLISTSILHSPLVTILVYPDPDSSSLRLVTHRLREAAPHQEYELMMMARLEQLDAQSELLEAVARRVIQSGRPLDDRTGDFCDASGEAWIGVLGRSPNDTVAVDLIPFTHSINDLSTTHPRWKEFIERLEGLEGLDAQLETFIGPPSRFSVRKKKQLRNLVKNILATMDIHHPDSWTCFEHPNGR